MKNSSKRGVIFADPTASASNRDLRSPNSAVESSAVTRLQSLDATSTTSGGNGNNTTHYTVVATDCRRSALLLNTQPPYKTLNHQRYSESSSSGQVKTLKSVNLQYNTLVRWADGTNDSSTKCLMFQVCIIIFFIKSCKILGKNPSIYFFMKLQK